MKQIIILTYLLIYISQSTVDKRWDIGLATDRIVAVSAGDIHLTLVVAPNNSSTVRRVDMVDLYMNFTATLIADLGLNVSKISQIKGTNSQSSNSYLLQYITTPQINNIIKSSNFSTTLTGSPWQITTQSYNTFGANTSITYELANTVTGDCKLSRMFIGSTSILQTSIGYTCYAIGYRNNVVYSLMYKMSTNTILLTYHNTLTQVLISSHTLKTVQAYTNLKLSVYDNFYTLGYNTQIHIYRTSNHTSVCNISIGTQIYSLLINDRWLYVSTSTQIQQYDAGICTFFSYYNTSTSMEMANHVPNPSSGVYFYERVFAWNSGSGLVAVLEVQDRYRCPGGCTNCINYYQTDGNMECWYSGVNNVNAAASTPLPPNMPVIVPITPVVPAPASGINACYQYNSINKICQIYCDYKCKQCIPATSNTTSTSSSSTSSSSYISPKSICTTCSTNRQPNPTTGQCTLPTKTILITFSLNILNTFRINNIQSIYYILDNLQLYQYHQIQYIGIIDTILNQLNYLQTTKWTVIPFECITDWVLSAYDDVPYCMNTLFYMIAKLRVSVYLRVYSFWLELAVILILSNSTKLCYLVFSYMQVLFRFDVYYVIIHAFSVIVMGIFVIILLSLFFMSQILYGTLCKYFLINTFRIKLSFFVSFIRFSIRPLIQAALHVFLYKNGQLQIICLSILQMSYFIIIVGIQLKFQIFRSKIILFAQLILSVSMAIMNLFIYGKYYMFSGHDVLVNIFEELLEIITMFMAVIIIVSFIYPIIFFMASKIYSVFFMNQSKSKKYKHRQQSKIEYNKDYRMYGSQKASSISSRKNSINSSETQQFTRYDDIQTKNTLINPYKKQIYIKYDIHAKNNPIMRPKQKLSLVKNKGHKSYKRNQFKIDKKN